VVLRSRAADKCKSGEVNDRIDDGFSAGVVEELVDGSGEVKPAGVDADDPGTTGLELGDERDVVGVILSVDVGLLEDDSNNRGVGGVDAGVRTEILVVPVEVGVDILKDNVRGDGVPDGLVGEKDGLRGEVTRRRGRAGGGGGEG
jgi:hypothetical protein